MFDSTHRYGELLFIAGTLRLAGFFTGILYRREQHCDQYRDDGDDNQQLDERKGVCLSLHRSLPRKEFVYR
jgi:hypothetical protein